MECRDERKLLEFLAHRAPVDRFALALLIGGKTDESGDEDADYHDVSCLLHPILAISYNHSWVSSEARIAGYGINGLGEAVGAWEREKAGRGRGDLKKGVKVERKGQGEGKRGEIPRIRFTRLLARPATSSTAVPAMEKTPWKPERMVLKMPLKMSRMDWRMFWIEEVMPVILTV